MKWLFTAIISDWGDLSKRVAEQTAQLKVTHQITFHDQQPLVQHVIGDITSSSHSGKTAGRAAQENGKNSARAGEERGC